MENKKKLATIICEFNPLHTGHKRLIDFAKSLADNVVCIMSGNFTQRGLPACADKYARAKHAILAGADLVVELPTIFATSPAENFALGGVKIADKLGADLLVFGSECGDIEIIKRCAEEIDSEQTNKRIKEIVSTGVSYPKAVALATGSDILSKPNNVLAVEYLHALKKIKSAIIPVTLQREDNFNGDKAQQFASSAILRSNKSLFDAYSFDYVLDDIDWETEQNYKNIATSFVAVASKDKLEKIEGVSEGLHNRIYNCDKAHGYDRMIESIKTKRYTWMKIQRIVLNCVLDITRDVAKENLSKDPNVNPLAVRSTSASLLALTDKKVDVITERADRLYATLGKISSSGFIVVD